MLFGPRQNDTLITVLTKSAEVSDVALSDVNVVDVTMRVVTPLLQAWTVRKSNNYAHRYHPLREKEQ